MTTGPAKQGASLANARKASQAGTSRSSIPGPAAAQKKPPGSGPSPRKDKPTPGVPQGTKRANPSSSEALDDKDSKQSKFNPRSSSSSTELSSSLPLSEDAQLMDAISSSLPADIIQTANNLHLYAPSQGSNPTYAARLPTIKRFISSSVVKHFDKEPARLQEVSRCFAGHEEADISQIKFVALHGNQLMIATDSSDLHAILSGAWPDDAFRDGVSSSRPSSAPKGSTRVPVVRFRILKEAINTYRDPYAFETELRNAFPSLDLSLIKWWNIDNTVVSICTDCAKTRELLSGE